MSLAEQLEKDYLVAYKAKDSVRLGVLRLLKTALTNFEKEHRRKPDDDDVLAAITRQCKQRQDSIEQFKAAGRPELAAKEAAEYDVLCGYMPPRLEGDELHAAVAALLAETGALGPKDMGKVMQALNSRFKGRVDGKSASDAVRSALQALV